MINIKKARVNFAPTVYVTLKRQSMAALSNKYAIMF